MTSTGSLSAKRNPVPADWDRDNPELAHPSQMHLTGEELHAAVTGIDNVTVGDVLEAHKWKFASTMKWVPHFYTLRRDWQGPPYWEAVATWMRINGVVMKWGKYQRPYFDCNGWRYWTMGSPMDDTYVINREKIETSKAKVVEGA